MRLVVRLDASGWRVVKSVVSAAVVLPAAVVLLVGGAVRGIPVPVPTAPGLPGAVSAVGPSTVARPFAGISRGCSVSDPTGPGGCVTPVMTWLLAETSVAFGPLPTSCWDEHAWNPASDHPFGRGRDTTFGALGRRPGPVDEARGWAYAQWLHANAQPLRVSYVNWAGRIWSATRADEGWRPYTGGGVYDPDDTTGSHHDHVYVSTVE